MVKHIATLRRRLVVALFAAVIAAIATPGCGVKGPLVPAPKATTPAPSEPAASPPAAHDAPPAPPADNTDVPRKP